MKLSASNLSASNLSASCAGAVLAAAVLLGSAVEASAARRGVRLPAYDVTSNCSLAQRGMALCLSANDGDRAFLRRVWASTPAAVRARCVGAVDHTDPRAYAELASCVYPVVGWGYTRDQSYAYNDPGLTRFDRRRRALCTPGEVFPLSGLCNQPGDDGRGSLSGSGTATVRDPGGNTPSTPSTPSDPSGSAHGYGTVTTTTITTEIHGRNGTVTGTETRSGSTTTFTR